MYTLRHPPEIADNKYSLGLFRTFAFAAKLPIRCRQYSYASRVAGNTYGTYNSVCANNNTMACT